MALMNRLKQIVVCSGFSAFLFLLSASASVAQAQYNQSTAHAGELYNQCREFSINADFESVTKNEIIYIEGWKKGFGVNSIDYANGLQMIGNAFYGQGNTVRTQELYLEALSVYDKSSVAGDVYVVPMLSILAQTYASQDDPERAEQFYKRALTDHQQSFGV